MTKKHSYKNPSKARHDLAKVEVEPLRLPKYDLTKFGITD